METICEQCGHRFCYELSDAECPKCGSLRLELHGGEQVSPSQMQLKDEAMTKQSLIKTLQSNQFLEDLPAKYIEQIAEVSRMRDYVNGEVIFHEGEAAGAMYLIVSGAVCLKISEGGHDSKKIVTLRTGELLGWSSLTNHRQYAATAVVDGPTRVIEIDGARMQALCKEDAKFGYEILWRTIQTLSGRLISTWSQLENVYLSRFAPVEVGGAAQND
jgi:CRP/FNR family transcriptional regulator, cyclic AMP receptor protein